MESAKEKESWDTGMAGSTRVTGMKTYVMEEVTNATPIITHLLANSKKVSWMWA